MKWTVEPARRLVGEVAVPGDKSISHRAVLLAAIADGVSDLEGLADGDDVAASTAAVASLGAEVQSAGSRVRVRGDGLGGWRPPPAPIDCGNSGTTMRLLAGLLAGQGFASEMTGDASLRRRPMQRIAEPLLAMGARIETGPSGTAPLRIVGAPPLRAVTFRPEVASAQVKSCVLLAGLYADGPTTVIESAVTRDHTERLLTAMGARVWTVEEGPGTRVTVEPGPRLTPLVGRVPGDLSSAAYLLVAAALLEGSDLRLPGVGMNPTRAGVVELLVDWGAEIEIVARRDWHGEPVADLRVRGTGDALRGGVIESERVAALIDELPLLAALGARTETGVVIRDAAELRVKESDRIATTAAALRGLGVDVDEFPDGLAVRGGQEVGAGSVDAAGDHRIALAMGALALTATGPVEIDAAEAMAVSYPGFGEDIERVAAR